MERSELLIWRQGSLLVPNHISFLNRLASYRDMKRRRLPGGGYARESSIGNCEGNLCAFALGVMDLRISVSQAQVI